LRSSAPDLQIALQDRVLAAPTAGRAHRGRDGAVGGGGYRRSGDFPRRA
jgi:hypothetical protein